MNIMTQTHQTSQQAGGHPCWAAAAQQLCCRCRLPAAAGAAANPRTCSPAAVRHQLLTVRWRQRRRHWHTEAVAQLALSLAGLPLRMPRHHPGWPRWLRWRQVSAASAMGCCCASRCWARRQSLPWVRRWALLHVAAGLKLAAGAEYAPSSACPSARTLTSARAARNRAFQTHSAAQQERKLCGSATIVTRPTLRGESAVAADAAWRAAAAAACCAADLKVPLVRDVPLLLLSADLQS